MKGKRILSLILTGALGVSSMLALGACAGGGENYDFTVWVPMVSTVVGEYQDHQVFQELEKRTGKKVKYVHEDYDKLSNKFGTNKYYDVMILNDSFPSFGGTYPGGVEKGIADGKIIDISDKMQTQAPNYFAIANSSDAIRREVITDAGKLNAFYEITDADMESWYGYMMREDWLAKVPGFGDGTKVTKIPETYADWEKVFAKFTEFNGKQAPFFLYSKGVDPFNSISAGYGVTFDFQLDETGKINYGPYMDGFKDYLDLMRKWYKAGWIDKNYVNSSSYVAIADAVGGIDQEAQFGVFTQMYIYMTQYEKTAKAFGNQNYSLIAVPNPRLTSGQSLHVRQKSTRAGNYAVITDKCKDVDGVMQWLDYLYSEEGRLLLNYGIEDVSYTMEDGLPQYTALVTDNPNKMAPSDAIKKFSVQGFPSFLDSKRELQVAKPKEIEAMHTWTSNNDASYVLPTLSFSIEESNRYGQIMASLQTYTGIFIYEYISSAAGAETFDQYRAKLKSYGIEEAIAIEQAAYERWLMRV